jgi:hypothetical protein
MDADQEPQKDYLNKIIEQRSPPSSSNLLNKILCDYNALFVSKIMPNNFTVYDLLPLIENISENLNKFFEDFLYFYQIIIFKVNQ